MPLFGDVPLQTNSSDPGNCSTKTWDFYESEKYRLNEEYTTRKQNAVLANRTKQNEWLHRNNNVNITFGILMSMVLIPICFWLDKDNVNVAAGRSVLETVRNFAEEFKKVHSKGTIVAICFLFTIQNVLCLMSVVFAVVLDNGESAFLVWMMATAQYPLFHALTKLFNWHSLLEDYDTIRRIESIDVKRIRGYAWIRNALLKPKKFYTRNFSMRKGKYYIEKMWMFEMIEWFVQAFALKVSIQDQDKGITLVYAAVLSLNMAIAPIFLARRLRFGAALSDCLFDLIYVGVGFFTIYKSSSNYVSLDVKFALMFPICSLCYIGNSIATTLCLRNYRFTSRSLCVPRGGRQATLAMNPCLRCKWEPEIMS